MKKILLLLLITGILFTFGACKKEKEQPVAEATQEQMPQGPIVDISSTPKGHGAEGQKTEFQVVVPPEIKAEWRQVVIIVEDRKENKTEEYRLNIGDEFKLPASNLTLKIGPFLPDFKMSGTVITSASNELVNPSVGIAVFEDGKQIFPASGEFGWLYSKFPTIHSFQHERYGLILKEGFKQE